MRTNRLSGWAFFVLAGCAAGAAPPDRGTGEGHDAGTIIDRDAQGIDAQIVLPDGNIIRLDATTPSCTEGTLQCGVAGVERCSGGVWSADHPCPAGCAGGACTDAPVSCTADATRCYRRSVQRCNRDGTAWLHDSVCPDGCSDGLCTGACVATETRCNGNVRETCDGSGWSSPETCTIGCEHRACVENELVNNGVVQDLSGTHVYRECVGIDLGGELRVPAGQTLEIWARCLRVSASSSITLGAGSTLRFHARETIDVDGTVSGGNEVFLEALVSLSHAGMVSSTRTILRADMLTIESTGRTAGTSVNAALYGSAFTNGGMHTGIVSVMPPTPLGSPTHPSGGVWNLNGDEVVIAWDRPFPSAFGYYVSVGDAVPSPATAELRTEEFIVLPLDLFRPGTNRVRVVSVNADSEVGTYTEDFTIEMNVRPPMISSSSHPHQGEWGGPDDVFLSWTDPSGVPASTWAGYYYAWDRQADTVPGPSTGTFEDRRMLLLADQAPGIWYFHIVDIDRLGRTSPLVAHYQVRIGADPGRGNVAGTITDPDGMPIDGAIVVLNGGLMRTVSGPTGDYTFRGEVPAASDPYRVTASARGFETAEAMVAIASGTAAVQHFMLARSSAPPADRYALGWELNISATNQFNPDFAVGPPGRYIWSRFGQTGAQEEIAIVDEAGTVIHSEAGLEEYYDWLGDRTDVGWNGSSFYAIDTFKCLDSGTWTFGHGWSCLRMRTWNPDGVVQNGWTVFGRTGHSGAPSTDWNSASYGVFFVSYSAIYFRDLTSDLRLSDGEGPGASELFASGYGDTRQSARTRAVWDGSAYAVIWSIEASSTVSATHAYFARASSSGASLLAPIDLGVAQSNTNLALVYDGRRYHVAYATDASHIRLQTIETSGALGASATIMGSEPSMDFDGISLLIAAGGNLEARSPSDLSVTQTMMLGSPTRVRIASNPATGESALLLVRASGTSIMPLRWR